MSFPFSIADVTSLRADRGSVSVDIGYLGQDDHLNAFIEIFERFIHDNTDMLAPFTEASVISPEAPTLTLAEIRGAPRDVARKLYLAHTPQVRILLSTGSDKKLLTIGFDNPLFEFTNAR